MYYLWFVTCDGDTGASLTVSGRTVWHNPHGYLQGMMRHMRPFFGTLSLAYGALAFWLEFIFGYFWLFLVTSIFGYSCLGHSTDGVFFFNS